MRLAFMGSPEFAAVSLRALTAAHEVTLVVTQPDKRKGRGKNMVSPVVKTVADELGIDVIQPRSAKTGELAEALRSSGAELAVVVAYGKILPTEVLEALPGGCLNVHASLLPRYRGAAPIQWAVIDGIASTGVSIMALDEGMDTGPVYARREVAIKSSDTSGDMFNKLAVVGAQLLVEVLAAIESGIAQATPQDESLATHARMLTKADGLVDWNASARVVACLIRGVDPWPGAQSNLGELGVKLFAAAVAQGSGKPGEVLAISEEGIVLACGEGAVLIRELQAAGSRRMSAIACARGRHITVGSRFGANGEVV